MSIKCGSIAMVASSRPVLRPMFVASNTKTNTEQLRTQLDQLHTEAQTTRAKANNARMRLLRLSEAAEKLKRQAVVSVHTGNEDDARELLFQKKKIMQSMERSKSRIELLDKLSAKLTEAISVKETQLIGNVALDLEVDREDSSGPIRVVSPKEDFIDDRDDAEEFGPKSLKLENDDLQFHSDDEANPPVAKEREDFGGYLRRSIGNEEGSIISSLKGISSYGDFLEHVDQQLNKIEVELVTVLNVSTLVMNDKEKPKI
ncbi:hypothetical protein HS088_TW17G00020 [Tripterygium wilfordii]|uniref:Uncharacterized protein n=1 Tax=Tripterygium wilfordii TaxID=458696 RepID=A0A7J7CED3_TRIWF|nr:hypothetical protein HS088_TW17G00020 [Tripterygium wilfordii]